MASVSTGSIIVVLTVGLTTTVVPEDGTVFAATSVEVKNCVVVPCVVTMDVAVASEVIVTVA